MPCDDIIFMTRYKEGHSMEKHTFRQISCDFAVLGVGSVECLQRSLPPLLTFVARLCRSESVVLALRLVREIDNPN